MYKLIIQDDEGKTTVVPLIREELTIGRQEGNTIRLTERNVSRRHAKLLRSHEAIMIEDLDSYNGVRVNGSRIEGKTQIKEADRVQIGDYLIEVKAEQTELEAAADQAETVQISAIPRAPVPVVSIGSEAVTAPNPAPNPAPNDALATDIAIVETPPAGTTPLAEENGRLVILSTGMAGQEYELDKPAMVIGRTDENDICVNHRSISRHHAKVIRENSTYSVVDLHSANGVRVNGEEYGKVELRRGDLVDLGHVRFRYVAPGEDFLFGRDAHAVDIATEGKGGKGIWALLFIVAAAVIAFFVLGNSDEGSSTTAENPVVTSLVSDAGAIPHVEPIPTSPSDASTAPADATPDMPPDIGPTVSKYIEMAHAAKEAQDWAAMATAANHVLSSDPTHAEAIELAAEAAFEGTNKQVFQSFKRAVADRKWAQVALNFANIDQNSVYKAEAKDSHSQLKSEFETFHLGAARKAAKRNKCSEISRIASRVPAHWKDTKAKISGVSCTRVAVTPTRPDVRPPEPPAYEGPPVEELIKQASKAVQNGHHGKGERLCSQALELQPGNQQAAMICGIAACRLKRSALAKKYIRRVHSATRKSSLRQICLKNDVDGFE